MDLFKQKWNSRKLVGFLLMFACSVWFAQDGTITGADWLGFVFKLFLVFIFAELAVKSQFLGGEGIGKILGGKPNDKPSQ
jgi:hypothetical protein